MNLFRQLNNNGKTIVMVTHEKEIAAYAKRILYVRDGQVIETHLEHVISATGAGN